MKGINALNIFRNCNSWQDFRNRLQALTKKQKGDSFESFTKYFLQLHPEYVTLLKNIWHLKEVPSNIRKKLNL
ncbi:MAG: hypothetical protein AAB228_03265, partial [Nitrospirota bacterium]